MSIKVNVNGANKEMNKGFVNVSDLWKPINKIFIYTNENWKETWVDVIPLIFATGSGEHDFRLYDYNLNLISTISNSQTTIDASLDTVRNIVYVVTISYSNNMYISHIKKITNNGASISTLYSCENAYPLNIVADNVDGSLYLWVCDNNNTSSSTYLKKIDTETGEVVWSRFIYRGHYSSKGMAITDYGICLPIDESMDKPIIKTYDKSNGLCLHQNTYLSSIDSRYVQNIVTESNGAYIWCSTVREVGTPSSGFHKLFITGNSSSRSNYKDGWYYTEQQNTLGIFSTNKLVVSTPNWGVKSDDFIITSDPNSNTHFGALTVLPNDDFVYSSGTARSIVKRNSDGVFIKSIEVSNSQKILKA